MTAADTALARPRLARQVADRGTLALLGLFLLGVAVIWAAPRPQMIDLPQHAAQVALLRDLVRGTSPWAGDVRVNLATPYLIGYGLALPLSFVMSAGAALKTVLTVAYAAFILLCAGIGREVGASRKLEGYYAISFFGFAYVWGMYTFLVAAPVGLAFLWLCIRYARAGRPRQGAGVVLLGLALLFSHGLVFLFAAGLGALLLLLRAPSIRSLVVRSWPFWILLCACAGVFLLTQEHESALRHGFGTAVHFGPWQGRVAAVMVNTVDAPYAIWPVGFFLLLAALPLAAGFRPDWRNREAAVLALGPLGVIAFAPHYAWSTSFLFERFALFLPPAYAWLLRERSPTPGNMAIRLQPGMGILAGVACAALLAQHIRLARQFADEQRDFEPVLAAAAPGARALTLVLDPASAVDGNRDAYQHHALWYQADRGGFVDFNFAWFHPEVVRFRPGRIPPIDEVVAQDPRHFDWKADAGDRYRYVFVRSSGPPPADLFKGAPCPPQQVAASGKWRLYERSASCPPA